MTIRELITGLEQIVQDGGSENLEIFVTDEAEPDELHHIDYLDFPGMFARPVIMLSPF